MEVLGKFYRWIEDFLRGEDDSKINLMVSLGLNFVLMGLSIWAIQYIPKPTGIFSTLKFLFTNHEMYLVCMLFNFFTGFITLINGAVITALGIEWCVDERNKWAWITTIILGVILFFGAFFFMAYFTLLLFCIVILIFVFVPTPSSNSRNRRY